MSVHDPLTIIGTKRDGGTLDDDQIRWVLEEYTADRLPAEQMAALCMAVLFQGLDRRELVTWTRVMLESGTRLDLSGVSRPTVDKHSTGGVGDKVSLVLCPLVAACGAAVPQLSGRGLGHTGGTLDKMESIPGWRAELPLDQMVTQLDEVGAVIVAANQDLAPADRRLYALRDVTGTVPAIPLIASSIMSKKIAEGTQALVLDVKVGSGAFLPERERAQELAATMVELGRDDGLDTRALITDMDAPLGVAAGNALEVAEAVETLEGAGPADLVEVTLALAREMLDAVGIDDDPAARLADGSALAVWRQMVAAQGGDPDAELPTAAHRRELTAEREGIMTRVDAKAVGMMAWRLGAGRARQSDPVSPVAGVLTHVRPGERVQVGQPLVTLLTDDPERFAGAEALAAGGLVIGDEAPSARPLVVGRIGP